MFRLGQVDALTTADAGQASVARPRRRRCGRHCECCHSAGTPHARAPERRSAILVGGSPRAALKRAARIGDGWHPLNLVGASLSDGIACYRATCADYGRPIGRVLARVFPPGLKPGPERDVLMGDDPVATREVLAAFGAAGTDGLVISCHDAGWFFQ